MPSVFQSSVFDTAASLHNLLAELGARCIVEWLAALVQGALTAVPQPEAGLTYASKIQKSEAIIDWSKSAEVIDRQVRAFNPFPVASTTLDGEVVRIWRARWICRAFSASGLRSSESSDRGK